MLWKLMCYNDDNGDFQFERFVQHPTLPTSEQLLIVVMEAMSGDIQQHPTKEYTYVQRYYSNGELEFTTNLRIDLDSIELTKI